MALRQSESFIWSVSELIGQGATGNVFICRSKTTGKSYAAKVFNSISQMRSKDVRMREIQLLGKLTHPNIVKLEGVEFELSTKATVLVMELCEKSLYNILELPENYYGLSEEEFKNVFEDVANGMKYLKEQKIVHRDVKPGNILKKRCIVGRALFKLTDFGAARELQQEDQRFVSIYGTEEYLHPDVYEKAVMKNFSNKSFDAAVDLWSMGVTFYHTATGQLPFRPYGGRQNKETMFEIISKKGPRVISGVQKSNAGRIDYDENLPKDTRISNSLKNLLMPALQELLETNPEQLEHMIGFDQFYNRVDDVVHRKVIDLYSVGSGTWHFVYMKQNETVKYLQELIYEQTGITADNQLFFYSSKELCQNSTCQYGNMVTTRANPLIVFGGDIISSGDLRLRRIPDPPRMPKGKTRPDNDIDILKLYAGVCYQYMFCAEDMFWSCKAMLNASEVIQNAMKKRINKCQHSCAHLKTVSKLLDPLLSRLKADVNIMERVDETSYQNQDSQIDVRSLIARAETLINGVPDKISGLLEEASSKLSFNNWIEINEDKRAETWLDTIKKLVEDADGVYTEISKTRHFGQSNLEDLIHVAKKQKVTESLEKIKEDFMNLKGERDKLHTALNDWIRGNFVKFEEIKRLQECLSAEEGRLLDEEIFAVLEQMKLVNSRCIESLIGKHSGIPTDADRIDINAINNEVLSLENAFQDVLALVEEGDQKLLRTKEIFDELTVRKF